MMGHTAVVPPADIRVNGRVLFANVANGESLRLVVPADTYTVEIVPAGRGRPVILGPLKLTVQAGSLNRVFAIGAPDADTMTVAVHLVDIEKAGSDRPSRVDTGSGGQAVGAQPPLATRLFG